MPFKKCVLRIDVIVVVLFCEVLCYAASDDLILNSADLTWVSYPPNENIKTVVEDFQRKHNVSVYPMTDRGMRTFVSGDPTPDMAWFMSFSYDSHSKLNGINYEHFKVKKAGLRFATGKGVEIGSDLKTVYAKYGLFPEISRTQRPGWTYVQLKYPFLLEETGQKGMLSFTLRHQKGTPEESAIVVKMAYQL